MDETIIGEYEGWWVTAKYDNTNDLDDLIIIHYFGNSAVFVGIELFEGFFKIRPFG